MYPRVCVCVCTATTSVLVNGIPTDEFPMERGLRQGDPLSPFLFLLAAEGLNVMMRAMVQSNIFTGYSIGSTNPTVVSHLQFADDTLLMGAKSWANVPALQTVLVLFEKVSELKVNFHKSMLAKINIGDSWLTEAASVLGCVVGNRKISWISWKNVCMAKEHGGLGVRHMRYGEEAGWLVVGGRSGSVWWREVSKIVTEGRRGNDAASCERGRKRSMLGECRNLLYDIVLQPNISDHWLWQHDTGGGYYVRGAYNLLITMDAHDADVTSNLIWHKQVPLKVSVLAWRLLHNRLPTKDNLATRNIISHESQLCVTGCGGLETAHHLFLSCPIFAPLWGLVRSWIGMSSADPVLLQDHFIRFIHSSGGLRARRSFLQLVWLCCISVIWTERTIEFSRPRQLQLTKC
ncbi:cytochrome P450 [Trifolium medium]|uniref:Cytochrome P450 n=1 Tax=Trifolium medium TaxID=97028 RepID=A0A392M0A0_9FABA|nr:cytochrome P450 [Trifolium medium]